MLAGYLKVRRTVDRVLGTLLCSILLIRKWTKVTRPALFESRDDEFTLRGLESRK
jgi:hypothetical protein